MVTKRRGCIVSDHDPACPEYRLMVTIWSCSKCGANGTSPIHHPACPNAAKR